MQRTALRLSLILVAAFWFQPFNYAQNISAGTETALRSVVDELFGAYAREDIDGYMKLWSANSPDLATRRKALQELFSVTEKIEVKSLTISKMKEENEKASLLVAIEITALDAKIGKPAQGFGTMNRALDFVKEQGQWKVWKEAAAEERLATDLLASKTDAERVMLLDGNTELVTETLWRALNRLGRRSAAFGSNSEALKAYGLALSISERIADEAGIAASRNNIGLVHIALGDYETALTFLQESLRAHQAQGNKLSIAQTMNSIATAYELQGDYSSALALTEESLKLQEELGNKQGIAQSLIQLGGIYQNQGNYQLALDHAQKALKLSEESGNKIGIADSLHEIGSIHLKQGNYSEALLYLQKNVDLLEALQHKAGIAYLIGSMGLVHYRLGNYESSLKLFQRTLELSEAVGDKRGIVRTFYNFSNVYYALGDYARSLEYSERAAQIAGQMGNRELLWRARNQSGKALLALLQNTRARQAFQEAISIIESLRAQVGGGRMEQQLFFEDKVSAYHSMVELLVSQNEPVEALTYAERAKARVLLDVLRSGKGDITKAMTLQERERERQLKGELVELNSQISGERMGQSDQARTTDLNGRLQKARLNYEAFQSSLYAAHPELRVLRGEAKTLKIDEAGALLPDLHSAMLQYVVTPDKSYLFVLSRQKQVDPTAVNLKIYALAIRQKELADLSIAFREQLAKRDATFRQSASKLYDLLIKPAQSDLQGVQTLIIVADGSLWELPFQALQEPTGKYLIENYAISYAPSLTVLREMSNLSRKSNAHAPTRLLAMANPVTSNKAIQRFKLLPRDMNFGPLPEAEKEVKTVAEVYGASQSSVHIGSDAREDRFKKDASRFDVLHLATHGILNDASPMYSQILLAQSDDREDGLLEAWEIMKLDLNADLVVLSACESGRGRVGAGEGVIGLTWALFVAGSPASVVSQWKVESSSTSELMVEFHRNLQAKTQKQRLSKAKALQRAALKMLGTKNFRHPFYWAGFILVGDGS